LYTKITSPSVYAYDIDTNTYLGEAKFELTPESEKALLNWVNYRIPIESLVMVSSDFMPSADYSPIVPNRTYHQQGILRGLFTEDNRGVEVPIEMRITYDWRSRSIEPGNYLSSVEFSHIQIQSTNEVMY